MATRYEKTARNFLAFVHVASIMILLQIARATPLAQLLSTRPNDDGSPKVFRESAVGNLLDFFQRFRELNAHSSPQLDELVERARRAVRGVTRRRTSATATVCGGTSRRSSRRSGRRSTRMLVDRPQRRILRQAAAPGGG